MGGVVGEATVGAASIPESVGGMVDDVEAPGGCLWRRDACDGVPWGSLLKALSVHEEGGRNSEEYTVPAVVRDRGVDGGTGGS